MSENNNGWESMDVRDQPHEHVTVLIAVHVVALATESEDDIMKEALTKVIDSATDPDCPEDIVHDVKYKIAQREYCTEHNNDSSLPDGVSVNDIANVIAFPKRSNNDDSNES